MDDPAAARAAEDDTAERVTSDDWWRHPTIIAAAITGVLGLAGIGVTAALQRDSGPDQPTGLSARLTAEVTSFAVRCPATFVFDGTINATGGRGPVSYRIVHVDSFNGKESKDAIETVQFDGAQTTRVRHEWTPTVPEGEVFRTASIEIVSPVTLRSAEVTISGRCDARLPAGPSIPPPQVDPPR